MKRLMRLSALVVPLVTALAVTAGADVVVFTDGTEMEVDHYEIQGALVLLTTTEGKLNSVPLSYVDVEATERKNRHAIAPSSSSPPTTESPPSASSVVPSESIPIETIEPEEPVAPSAPNEVERTAPPPVWNNAELDVSLVLPSSSWQIAEGAASFDVAVSLEKPETEAKATLALVRQKTRKYEDYLNVVDQIRQSVSTPARYTLLTDAPVEIDSYVAHELRFVKDLDGSRSFNQLVLFYSRDLVYVLSLTCPEARREENEADFAALAHGLVIQKSKADLTPKGLP